MNEDYTRAIFHCEQALKHRNPSALEPQDVELCHAALLEKQQRENPTTNFDHTTASPEALAHALADRELMCDHCINDVTNCKEDCYHGIIDWLNSPQKSEAGGEVP